MGKLSRSTRVTVSKVANSRVQIPRGYAEAKIAWGGAALALSPLAIILLAVGLSAATEDEARRPVLVVLACVIAGVLLAALGGLAPKWNVRKQELRIANRGPLRFVSKGFCGPFQLGAALCFWAAAGLVARSLTVEGAPEVMGAFGTPASLIVLTTLGLLVAGNAVYKGLEPPSIKLDEHGLWIQRQYSATLLPWGEVDRAAARLDGRVVSLEISVARGYDVLVQQKYFGSDPYFVAEVVSHFLHAPHQRTALYDPIQALELAFVLAPGKSTP